MLLTALYGRTNLTQRDPRGRNQAMPHPRERRPGLSRRQFLRNSLGIAVALPSAAAILAACTKPGSAPEGKASAVGTGGVDKGGPYPIATTDSPVKWTIYDDLQPIADGLAPEQDATLQIYNWDQYVWKKQVEKFCAKFDCDYKITTFQNMDEALTKMRQGELDADVFFPTTDTFGKLIYAKLLQPVNKSYMPNLEKNVWPQLQSPYYDQDSQYSVPYVVYTTGIAYRRDVIPDDSIWGMDNPYDVMWESQYSGRVGVYDSYRDTMSEVLLRNGITDVNTEKQSDIDLVENQLLELIDDVDVRYSINGAYKLLPENQYDVHVSWSGDIVAGWFYVADGTKPEDLGYWYPEDRKGLIGSDTMAIPASAKNPVLAHEFLNFMLDEQISLDNFAWVGYQPPQNGADPDTLTSTKSVWGEPYVFPWMEAAVVRKEDFDVGYQQWELTPDVDDMWHDAWQNFRAGAK
jgi:spermidine/putrescine transport system substrate-binding protein